jgi:UDP:flavonoid glycosyltransferase YjiC (YdhE family)
MGRDQGDNAARVVARGAGLALDDSATEEQIVSAVGRLLAQPHFKAAAVRLGRAIEPDMTSSILETEIEAIAGRRWNRTA